MAFKDWLKKDQNIYFNVSEFAEIRKVDGRAMPVLVDEIELVEREKKAKSLADGVFLHTILLYVRVEDYGPRPKIGKPLNLDGKKLYRITDVAEESGIYSLTLQAARV